MNDTDMFMADQDGSNNAQGGRAGPGPRLAVKTAFRPDRCGPRGPLLEFEPLAGHGAPPDQAASGNEGVPAAIGWCTFSGCAEGFASWKEYVQHCKNRHCPAQDSLPFCSICLERVFSYEMHNMLTHPSGRRKHCSLCSAVFTRKGDLAKHLHQFHRRAPPKAHDVDASAGARPAGGDELAVGAAAPRGTVHGNAGGVLAVPGTSYSHDAVQVDDVPDAAQVVDGDVLAVPGPSASQGDVQVVYEAVAILGWCTFPDCSESFLSWDRYVDHCLERHDPGSTICPRCLVRHAEPHGQLDLECSWCPARFTSGSRLFLHKSQFHRSSSRRRPHRPPRHEEARAGVVGWCTYPHCARPCASWDEHVKHQLRSHFREEEKDAVCHRCLASDPIGGLEAHLQAHRLSDFPCSLCSARFIGDVSDHKKQFHHVTPEGRVPAILGWCTKRSCDASFSAWEDFVWHFINRHWRSDAARICHMCLLPLSSVKAAKQHVEKHSTQRKQYACEKCSVQFLERNQLDSHMKDFHKR